MKSRVLWLILLAGFALGSSTVTTRIGVQYFAPAYFLAVRFGIGALGFLMLASMFKPKLPAAKRPWLDMIIVGMATAIPMLLFAMALQVLSSGVLSLFIALIPVLTAAMAYITAAEKVSLRLATGLALSLAGVVFLIATGTTGLASQVTEVSLQGQGFALIGALLAAFAGVYMRRQLRGEDTVVITGVQQAASLAVLLPFALATSRFEASAIPATGWLAAIYSGIAGSILAFVTMTHLIKRYGATYGSFPSYIVPVVATLLGAVLLDEVISPSFAAAFALVLAGVILGTRPAKPS